MQQQERKTSRQPLSARSIPFPHNENEDKSEDIGRVDDKNAEIKKISRESSQNHVKLLATTSNTGLGDMKEEHIGNTGSTSISMQQTTAKRESDEPRISAGDETVVVKFVDTAIVGKSEAEDARHHGLVDPTINMKEAINAINSMFTEPLDTEKIGRRSHRKQKEENLGVQNGFEVFIDEDFDKGTESKGKKGVSLEQHSGAHICQPQQEPFKIFDDDEDNHENGVRNYDKENLEQIDDDQHLSQGSSSSATILNGFVFLHPNDLPSESSDDMDAERSPRVKLREDTVVHRFVGSTILDEPEVENVCHHGLVDPTINLKEAMEDINNMFGKPMDFVRAKRPKKQEKAAVRDQDPGAFSILPDDDLKPQHLAPTKPSSKPRDSDLLEPTMCTKEAMDEINKMFGMPL